MRSGFPQWSHRMCKYSMTSTLSSGGSGNNEVGGDGGEVGGGGDSGGGGRRRRRRISDATDDEGQATIITALRNRRGCDGGVRGGITGCHLLLLLLLLLLLWRWRGRDVGSVHTTALRVD